MRLFLRYLITVAAVVYLHRGVLPLLLTADRTPDLTIISIVYLGIVIGGVPGIFLGFGLGLISDLFGWGPVGVTALAGTLTAAASNAVRQQIYEYSLLVPVIISALGALVKGCASYVIIAVFAGPLSFGWHVVARFALQVGITAAAAVVLVFLYWRLLPPPRTTRSFV